MAKQLKLAGVTIKLDGNKWYIDEKRVHEATLDRFIAVAQAAALDRIARGLEKPRGSGDS